MKFFNYHTVPKNTRRVFPETRKQPLSELETSRETNLPFEKKNFKKVFGTKKLDIAEKLKKRHFRLIKRFFYKPKVSKNSTGTL